MLMMPDSNSIMYILVNTELMVIKIKVIIDLLILSGPFWASHGIQRNAVLAFQLQCLRIICEAYLDEYNVQAEQA